MACNREISFFGEIGALRSRANWSDSEDEEELSTTATEKVSPVLFTPHDLKAITASVLYITYKDLSKQTDIPIKGQVQSPLDPKIKCKIIQLSDEESWLSIETPAIKKDSFETANLVYKSLERCLGSTQTVVIVTVIRSEKSSIEFICNEFTSGNEISARFSGSKALPPTMVSSVPEAVAFEFCTARSIPASLVLVPNLEALNGSRLQDTINPMVLSSLQSLFSNHHLDSNIYI